MSTGKLRRDGSYRSNEGQQKLDKIRELADRIDGTDLSRIDSMTVFTVVDLLTNVTNRQLGRTPLFNERPARWTSGATASEGTAH